MLRCEAVERTSVHVPLRRFALVVFLAAFSLILRAKERMRSTLYPTTVEVRRTDIFVVPNTRRNFREMFTKFPLSPAFADSETCRRLYDLRQAVVPGVMRCQSGSSAAEVVTVP